MLSRPIEMDKYIRTGGDKPVVIKEAPEEYKKIARETNDELVGYGLEPHYIIEEEENNHD